MIFIKIMDNILLLMSAEWRVSGWFVVEAAGASHA